MLGEQIGEETGKVIVRRVIAGEGRPRVEVSVQSNGKLLGVETRGMVTYTATVRADGSVYGEGLGIVTGKNGEAAMMRVAGAGRLSGGAVSYRGAAYFEAESEKWKRLNTIAVVYEYEADADGNARSKSWEWK
jgi:nitrous oxidase accessory protein NosD